MRAGARSSCLAEGADELPNQDVGPQIVLPDANVGQVEPMITSRSLISSQNAKIRDHE